MYEDLKTLNLGGIRTRDLYVLEADAVTTMPRHKGKYIQLVPQGPL
jgi:hypothetical protein